ncbi:MAG: DeoR family transcriptional regulator [[Clostridium] nexile]
MSKQCGVTEETIRRDLDKLEADGIVTRVHGGAIWNEGTRKEMQFYRRLSRHLKEKQEIARKASVVLEENTQS